MENEKFEVYFMHLQTATNYLKKALEAHEEGRLLVAEHLVLDYLSEMRDANKLMGEEVARVTKLGGV